MEKKTGLIYGMERTPRLDLDKQLVLDTLVELVEELELDIDLSNLQELVQLLGEDDNDFLGNLASLAAENGLDPEEFFERLGIAHMWGS